MKSIVIIFALFFINHAYAQIIYQVDNATDFPVELRTEFLNNNFELASEQVYVLEPGGSKMWQADSEAHVYFVRTDFANEQMCVTDRNPEETISEQAQARSSHRRIQLWGKTYILISGYMPRMIIRWGDAPCVP